jgi:hypothetical protein
MNGISGHVIIFLLTLRDIKIYTYIKLKKISVLMKKIEISTISKVNNKFSGIEYSRNKMLKK